MINTCVSSGTTSHIATAAFSLVYWNAQFCLPLSGEYGEPKYTQYNILFWDADYSMRMLASILSYLGCCFSHLAETTLVGEISGVNQHI